MTDRELLEAAAKAAGLTVRLVLVDGSLDVGADHPPWNPLTDDGDALRLAMKLRMNVDPWGAGASAVVWISNRAHIAEPHYGDDPGRATRRAIVRAAAAMSVG